MNVSAKVSPIVLSAEPDRDFNANGACEIPTSGTVDRMGEHSGSTRRNLVLAIVGIFGLLILLIIAVSALLPMGSLVHLSGMVRSGRLVYGVDQPAVVHEIQELQRLETVSYTMDKIISGERGNLYVPKFLLGDRILLVVHGYVTAGVDLGKLQASDVQLQKGKVSIRMPCAEVFSTRIDNAKTRVYSRDTGLFSSPDPNLESEVRAEAERQLQESALQDGILNAAAQNARTTIFGLLKVLGFQEVEFR